MSRAAPVICVDGPSGVGKGSVCYRLSRALGFHILDSGALYRLGALSARRLGIPLDDEDTLAELVLNLNIALSLTDGDPPVQARLDGEIVDQALRTEQCAGDASTLAALPRVREALLDRQRGFRRNPGLVADGRDMGTVVFPDAELKIFLIASPEERAQRRYNQLIAKGISANLRALLKEIRVRDERDSSRSAAPLKPAGDATVLDTTGIALQTVFEQAMALAAAKGIKDVSS